MDKQDWLGSNIYGRLGRTERNEEGQLVVANEIQGSGRSKVTKEKKFNTDPQEMDLKIDWILDNGERGTYFSLVNVN